METQQKRKLDPVKHIGYMLLYLLASSVASMAYSSCVKPYAFTAGFRDFNYGTIQRKYQERTKEEFQDETFDERTPRRDLVSITAEDSDKNGALETFITIDGEKYFLEQNISGVPPTLRRYEVIETQRVLNLK